MDVLASVATTLALAFGAGLSNTASQAVRDGYDAVKALIRRKYPAIDLTAIERAPDSEHPRFDVEEALRQAGCGGDLELLRLALALLETVQHEAPETAQAIGVSLEDIDAMSLDIRDVISSGTAVRISGTRIHGNVKIENIQAGLPPLGPKHSSIHTTSEPPPVPATTVILFLAANALNTDRLRSDEEHRAINEALRRSELRDDFALKADWAVRSTDLVDLLLQTRPDIVHFSGHGERGGALILEDSGGNGIAVSAASLGNLFAALNGSIRCVVLNACYSAAHGHAIAQHVDHVIGMKRSVGDRAAIAFARSFYTALFHGEVVASAFGIGCAQIGLEGLDEADTPTLVMRRGGQLWVRRGAAPLQPVASLESPDKETS